MDPHLWQPGVESQKREGIKDVLVQRVIIAVDVMRNLTGIDDREGYVDRDRWQCDRWLPRLMVIAPHQRAAPDQVICHPKGVVD
jgi:hypothetical protein